jgi:hypothetical protein
VARALLNARAMRSWFAFIPVVLLAGCDLYFGNGDDTVCADYGGGAVPPAQELRDPVTGTCVGGSNWGGCDDACGPCPVYTPDQGTGAEATVADMGLCQSLCTGLGEAQCEATPGCYAAFYDDPAADGKRDYGGCWQIAPSGPARGSCSGLDAYECSRHDNCTMTYARSDTGPSKFIACENETYYPGCAGTDCALGYHCEEQCYPDDGAMDAIYCQAACVPDGNKCAAIDCAPGYACVESCEYEEGGTLLCDAQCVPSSMDPGTCTGITLCDAIGPSCPAGTTPGIRNGCWSGYCIPSWACGPGDPGQCYGTVTCATPSPVCPSGTTPGILNGCPTGYCIPIGDCPLAACETLTSESACDGRGDCVPVYEGTNCTCTAAGCSCETLTYDHCEAAYMPL